MKRVEHYCDACGKQLTFQYADGDQDKIGIELLLPENLQAHLRKRHSCGSSSKSEWLHGREFCSHECLTKSVTDWLECIKDFFD